MPHGPRPGDFIVHYRTRAWRRDAARVAIVHLTGEDGPEEVFSTPVSAHAERAEQLAGSWARRDGTRAWRVRSDAEPELLS